MTRALLVAFSLGVLVAVGAAAQPAHLSVVSAGPTGELAALAEANEIRVVFSEPMVALGRIPQPVRAPFFQTTPAVPGTFRWSGTTILIFTPDPRRRLPYATRFEVTIDTSARALSGRTLIAPYTFTFTTPTLKLLATNWYRRHRRYDEPLVVALRFNQPVRAADVMAHLSMRYEKHRWEPPSLSSAARERLRAVDPMAAARFDAKVAAAARAAGAETAVPVALAATWDTRAFKRSPDLVVVQTTIVPPPESWIRLTLDTGLASPAGPATPASAQTYTIELERTFFVDGPQCATSCDPEAYNPIWLRQPVAIDALRKAMTASDVTDASKPRAVVPTAVAGRAADSRDTLPAATLEEAGFDRQPPATTFAVAIDGALRATDGQTLGYTWLGTIENWHERAFTSFGDGHGVWETGGGLQLPFYARNFKDVVQWAVPLAPGDLMPKVLELQRDRFVPVPPGDGLRRQLQVTPDKIQSFGLDLAKAVPGGGTGLVWAGIREGTPIERASRHRDPNATRSTLVQVTNLGLTVKDSPHAILVFVTRLDTGAPVAGARVSVVDRGNQTFWAGTTDADGLAAGPGIPLRDPRRFWDTGKAEFLVLAEKDGDVAYVGSNWHEGISPWEFGTRYDLTEASPVLRGTVFTDRGVYKPGEEVHVKAVLRADTATGIEGLAAGTPVHVTLLDSRSKRVDRRVVPASDWSSLEWTTTVPADAALGYYTINASLDDPDAPRPARPTGADEPGDDQGEGMGEAAWTRTVTGSFLVAAYRRPDFRVDANLAGTPAIAGVTLKGAVTARYLFGAPMKDRPARWTYRRTPLFGPPRELTERFPDERFVFVGSRTERTYGPETISSNEAKLDARGELVLDLETSKAGDRPYLYTLEGEVEDVSRQRIANRASLTVHPASYYIGVRRPPYFVDRRAGLETALVAVSPDGQVVPDVRVTVTLTQTQWHSVRRAEGSGFYTWETTRRDEPAGTWTATTAGEPVPLSVALPAGGYFTLRAEATDEAGRQTATELSFYSLGEGYTAWQRYDHNRIDLVPERATYKPGDTARIMVQSPWDAATALVTTEREGIRTRRRFALTSTQETIEVPIAEQDIPNVFVSVLLVKGRTAASGAGSDDGSDPGKPSFRMGYTELRVDDASKRLAVKVRANEEEYRPAARATVDVQVTDARGRGAPGEITLWAVDYGVLSLTAFRTPDVLGSIYVPKALQVLTTDNRQRIVSRRVLTPKGADEGGGGGADAGAGTLRKDFRVLAFWLGSVVADAGGRARATVTLPESLTTYRIMAVAADRASRFGSAESEIRINKPVTLKAAFPRFLAVGDRAHFGAVVASQLKEAGTALVTITSLDPAVLAFTGETSRTVQVDAGGAAEVRFDAAARAVGRARVQVTTRINDEGDAFEDTIPVEVVTSPETVAAHGQTDAAAVERLVVPPGVVPGVGGLQVELSSTAMVGLGESARYLVDYPYGCAEQRASRALALVLASDLGAAFRLPGIEPARLTAIAQSTLVELEKFQCPNGGFSFWPGDCAWTSPYLSSYVLHVMRVAGSLKYQVDRDVRERAHSYLEEQLSQPPPVNESWWPHYTAWQAFAVRELVEGGRNQDSNLTRLYGYRDRMPVFALAYLIDAFAKTREAGPRVEELTRRLRNAILPEGASAHVEELSDPYLLWFWNSNVRSTAIALATLAGRSDADPALVRSLVRWLMAARRDGRWGNTQENAWAMEALVAYYRKYEQEVPDFTALVTLGEDQLASQRFSGRSTEAARRDVPMTDLSGGAAAGAERALTFRKEGTGTLFYTTRLRYAVDQDFPEGLDTGFLIERSYAPVDEAGQAGEPATAFRAGDLVRVTLTLHLPKERRYVAVADPLPAGFEPVDSALATTATSEAERPGGARGSSWRNWWERGGFDHVERRDDRVLLFATRLAAGSHSYSYTARATTAGTFRTAPARAEEMYEPEVFGRTASVVVEIKR